MNERMADVVVEPEVVARLAAFEAAIPVDATLPRRERGRVPRRVVALAGCMAVVVVAGTAASGVLDGGVRARPGAFNPGQALHCQGVADMSLGDAAAWLAARGYGVTWQVEDHTPGAPKGAQRSHQQDHAPTSGVIEGAVFDTRTHLIVVVGTGSGAVRAEDCPN